MLRERSARMGWGLGALLITAIPGVVGHADPIVQFVSNSSFYRTGQVFEPSDYGKSQGYIYSNTTNPVVYAPANQANWGSIWLPGGDCFTEFSDNSVQIDGWPGEANEVWKNMGGSYAYTDQVYCKVVFNLLTESSVALQVANASLTDSLGNTVVNGEVLEPGIYTLSGAQTGNYSSPFTGIATFTSVPEPASLAGCAAVTTILFLRRRRMRT